MTVTIRNLLLTSSAVALLAQNPEPPAHPMFGDPTVHDIWLEFKQPDYWQQMLNNYQETSDDIPYIEASFRWNDVYFEKVGVRFKGNSSYRGSTTKKPFRIKLNEFVKGQKIGGAASYNLNNFWNDPSFVREKLYFDAYARTGLRAPRSNFANRYINGKYWGIYGLGEVINSDFLESRYVKAEQTGNLYKGASPGGSLEYLGDGPAAYAAFYEKKTNEDDTTWSDLIALTKALRDTPSDQAATKLKELLDIRSVLTALAMDNLTVNLDSYVGMGQNYFIYKRPSDGRWEWLPWDPSLAFGALAFGVQGEQLRTLPIEWSAASIQVPGGGGGPRPGGPGFGGPRPLATLLWSVPEFRAQYRAIYRDLVEKVLRPEQLVADALYLRQLIRPHVELDPNKLATLDAFDRALTEDVAPGVNQNQPGPGPGPNQPPPGPGPGPGGPGGPGGTAGAIPGLEGLVKARDESVRKQLDAQ